MPTDQLPYSSLILVEPSMMTKEILARLMSKGNDAWHDLIQMARTRRDVWDSRVAARQWMASRLPWKTWTPRAIDLFVVRSFCHIRPCRCLTVCRSTLSVTCRHRPIQTVPVESLCAARAFKRPWGIFIIKMQSMPSTVSRSYAQSFPSIPSLEVDPT